MLCCNRELFSGCAISFGAGVLLTAFLPFGVLVCVQGVAILGIGFVLFKS